MRIIRRQQAISQFEFGYLSNVEARERCEQRFPGLHFCSGFKGSAGVRNCVKSSYDTAQRIVSSLNDLNHQSNKGAL